MIIIINHQSLSSDLDDLSFLWCGCGRTRQMRGLHQLRHTERKQELVGHSVSPRQLRDNFTLVLDHANVRIWLYGLYILHQSSFPGFAWICIVRFASIASICHGCHDLTLRGLARGCMSQLAILTGKKYPCLCSGA